MNVRLDTYLWAIRMFKSRSLASDAIKGNKVKLNNELVKPAHSVKIGETYHINLSQGVKKIIEVTGFIDKRQSFEIAKLHYTGIDLFKACLTLCFEALGFNKFRTAS